MCLHLQVMRKVEVCVRHVPQVISLSFQLVTAFFPGLVERGTCGDGGDGIAILTLCIIAKKQLEIEIQTG